MARHGPEVDCFDLVGAANAALQEGLPKEDTRYYMLGGVASQAISSTDTTFYHPEKLVIAGSGCTLPNIRSSGSKRDIDILVYGNLSKKYGKRLKNAVSGAIDGQLKVSVFGFDAYDPSPRPNAHNLTDWLSKRTIDPSGVLRYELFPITQEVPEESYEPWQLLLPNDDTIPVLNPAAHMLAYAIRSISGVRAKDAPKLDTMFDRVMADPIFRESVEEGPLRPWLDFFGAIADLRNGNLPPADVLRQEAGPKEHAAFRWKGRFLRAVEGNEAVVNLALNEPVQRVLNVVVHSA